MLQCSDLLRELSLCRGWQLTQIHKWLVQSKFLWSVQLQMRQPISYLLSPRLRDHCERWAQRLRAWGGEDESGSVFCTGQDCCTRGLRSYSHLHRVKPVTLQRGGLRSPVLAEGFREEKFHLLPSQPCTHGPILWNLWVANWTLGYFLKGKILDGNKIGAELGVGMG